MDGSMVRVAAVLLVLGIVPTMDVDVTADPAGGNEDDYVTDEVVVQFRDGLPPGVLAWIESLGGTLLLFEPDLSWVSARFESEEAADDAIRAAQDRTDVMSADHDKIIRPSGGEFVPNDSFYTLQWGFPAVKAPNAWSITLGSQNISVAVLDSGIHGTHEDLMGNLCGPHGSYTGTSPLTDGDGHGTHVAGTIAAVTNNSIGVAGMSQSCLMSVQVTNQGAGQESWAAAGIQWATTQGAAVISMSLESYLPLYLVENASKIAFQRGVLLVAAAGNAGCEPVGGSVLWPAKYATMIAVPALEPPGQGSHPQSSCGPEVEISAPGDEILSTFPRGGYSYQGGTSMAAPHVSGAIALMKSVAPTLTPSAVRSILNNTADDLGDPGWDILTGWGRLNVTAAVSVAAGP